MTENINSIPKQLALVLLKIGAMKFSPDKPFTWASGYRMPIYNDNRLLLGNYNHRLLVSEGFSSLLSQNKADIEVIAGTATAGISPGTTLADKLQKPFIYVRDKSKSHGMKNQIEGILRPGDKVIVIEDVISTGESSLRAITAIQEAGGVVLGCLAIFSYDFSHALDAFRSNNVQFESILNYDLLLEVACKEKYLPLENIETLKEWREDPFGWGAKRGFEKQTLGG